MNAIRLRLAVILASMLASVASAQIRGDVNDDGVLDALDLDLCTSGIPEFPWRVCDFNDDGMITFEDRLVWIHELKGTWLGDKDLDGQFNSNDMILVFVLGKYETGEMAMWREGDVDGDLRFNSSDMVITFADGGFEKGPRLVGDYNRNGLLDAGDLDLQAIEMVRGEHLDAYDLNDDDRVDFNDRLIWVNDLKNTWIGDANLDLEFTPSDIVQIFAGGKYETGQTATWSEGDFNGDMEFDSGDLVAAFPVPWRHGGPKPHAASSTVPEPSSATLLTVSLILTLPTVRRRRH